MHAIPPSCLVLVFEQYMLTHSVVVWSAKPLTAAHSSGVAAVMCSDGCCLLVRMALQQSASSSWHENKRAGVLPAFRASPSYRLALLRLLRLAVVLLAATPTCGWRHLELAVMRQQ
jgi:hypothetical protein